MRRATTALALGLFVFGCGLAATLVVRTILAGEPVGLLTGVHGCWAGAGPTVEGPLLSDPEYGTAIKAELSRGQPSDGSIMPVMWPTGYTGLRLPGGEVEVLDQVGRVVATTGRRYELISGPGPNGVFSACGDVIPK
jgi:hypothetical protein